MDRAPHLTVTLIVLALFTSGLVAPVTGATDPARDVQQATLGGFQPNDPELGRRTTGPADRFAAYATPDTDALRSEIPPSSRVPASEMFAIDEDGAVRLLVSPNIPAGFMRNETATFKNLREKLGSDAAGMLSREQTETAPLAVIIEYGPPASADIVSSRALPQFPGLPAPGISTKIATLVAESGGEVTRVSKVLPLVDAKLTPKALLAVAASSDVRRIHAVSPVSAFLNTATPATLGMSTVQFSQTYGLSGWGVRIAVLDTGIDATHPDFNYEWGTSRVSLFKDFTGDRNGVFRSTAYDDHGHGTHVASIAAGTGKASGGQHRGIAPNATLMVGKVLQYDGWGSWDGIIRAIEWAVDPDGDPMTDDGADIITMSLGARCGSMVCDGHDAVSMAVNWAVNQGVVVTVAAGNDGPESKTIGTPAAAAGAIAVGAYDDRGTISYADDQLADFSSRGPTGAFRVKPDVTASGVNIRAALANSGSYVTYSGTSMATPAVAGMAALIKGDDWSATPAQVRARLASMAIALPNAGGFDQGAGAIRGNTSIDAEIVFSDATTSLGAFFRNSATSTASTIQLENLEWTSKTVSLRVEGVSSGLSASISPSKLTLGGRETATATVNLNVDPSTLPAGAYQATIRGDTARGPIRHVVAFVQMNHTALVPFKVESDAELDALAASSKSPFAQGSGATHDPYVLRDGMMFGFAQSPVQLFNTTKHILIRNMTFTETWNGPAVHLMRAHNVAIEDSVFVGNAFGIWAESGSALSVRNSDFTLNLAGLMVVSQTDTALTDNIFVLNGAGAITLAADRTVWSANGFGWNLFGGGLLIIESQSVRLRDNFFVENSFDLKYHMNLEIIGSDRAYYAHDIDATNEVNGMSFYYQYGGAFALSADTDFGGIFLAYVDSASIVGGRSWWKPYGYDYNIGADAITLVGSRNVALRGVDLDFSTRGYRIYGGDNINVSQTTMLHDNLVAFDIQGATNVTIYNVEVIDAGIMISNGGDIAVKNSFILGREFAVVSVGSWNVQVSSTNFSAAKLAWRDFFSTTLSLDRSEAGKGLWFFGSDDVRLTGNAIRADVVLLGVEGAHLSQNDVRSRWAGIALYGSTAAIMSTNTIVSSGAPLTITVGSDKNTLPGHRIDADNVANGRTIRYYEGPDAAAAVWPNGHNIWMGVENATITNPQLDGATWSLVMTSGITIFGLNATGKSEVELWRTTDIRFEGGRSNDTTLDIGESLRPTVSNMTFESSSLGALFYDVQDAVVRNNTFTAIFWPMLFIAGVGGDVHGNVLTNATYGIDAWGTTGLRIRGNTFRDVSEAAYFGTSSHHNEFVGNNVIRPDSPAAYDYGTSNDWNGSVFGNYWSSHTGPDANEDGIFDEPFVIGGKTSNASRDWLPRTTPVEHFDFGTPVVPVRWFIGLAAEARSASGAVGDRAGVGVDPAATAGYDSSFDSPEAPEPSFLDQYTQLYVYDGAAQNANLRRLNVSYLPHADPVEWTVELRYKGDAATVQLNWTAADTARIPPGLTAMLTTPTGTVNMREATHATFDVASGPSTTQVKVRVSSAVTHLIDLHDGWNMVSIPVVPADARTSAVFGPNVVAVYHWTGTNYVAPETIEPGLGYWVLALNPTQVSVTGTALPELTLALHEGWNMVGGPLVAGRIQNPPANVVTDMYHWTGANYASSSTFEPAKGYWLLVVSGSATVTIR